MRVLARVDDYDIGPTFGCFKIEDLKKELISWWSSNLQQHGPCWTYDSVLVLTLKSNRHSLMTKDFNLESSTIEKLNYFIDISAAAFKTVEQLLRDNNDQNSSKN